jgi:DNA-binding NarL/FixJ family response regulator
LTAGYRNKDIADMLHFAEGSVKNIVTELLQIFQVDSRQRLILAALEFGYKPQPEYLSGNGVPN